MMINKPSKFIPKDKFTLVMWLIIAFLLGALMDRHIANQQIDKLKGFDIIIEDPVKEKPLNPNREIKEI